jgi:hypothetical protein
MMPSMRNKLIDEINRIIKGEFDVARVQNTKQEEKNTMVRAEIERRG